MTLAQTSDMGLIELPSHCPAWCTTDHQVFALENEGLLSAAEATAHHRHGGDVYLDEIRSPLGEVEREGGAGWDLRATQYLLAPFDSSRAHRPQFHLGVHRGPDRTEIAMTAGEIRSFAAHLIACADKVEMGELA